MKRYKSPEEILDLINKYQAEMFSLSVKADELEHDADELHGTDEAFKCEGMRGRVAKLRKQVSWREEHLRTLGDRLAVIRTPVMLVTAGEDGTIPSV